MQNLKKLAFLLNDAVLLYLSLGLMLAVRYPGEFMAHLKVHLGPFSLLFLIWIFVFYLADLYRIKTPRTRAGLAKALLKAILVCGIASIVALYLFPSIFALTPKTNLVLVAFFFLIITYSSRTVLLETLGAGTYPVAFLGTSPLIQETVTYLERNRHSGYRVGTWRPTIAAKDVETLAPLLKDERIRMVVVAPSLLGDIDAANAIYSLLPFEMEVTDFTDFYEGLFEKVPLEEISSNWFLEHISARRPFYDAAKRVTDVVCSLVLGLLLLPLAIVVGLMIRLTSRGKAIFTQERMGKNNIPFTLVKFRTMKEGMEGALWTEERDPRITRLGAILRGTHLDEIPQLWNILRGDISFTGPRPERLELVEQYKKFPYYEMRHIVKPGLTGWAQINYRPSASLEEAYEKLRYDIYYVKNRSLFLDFLIFLRTLKLVFVTGR